MNLTDFCNLLPDNDFTILPTPYNWAMQRFGMPIVSKWRDDGTLQVLPIYHQCSDLLDRFEHTIFIIHLVLIIMANTIWQLQMGVFNCPPVVKTKAYFIVHQTLSSEFLNQLSRIQFQTTLQLIIWPNPLYVFSMIFPNILIINNLRFKI